MIFLLDTNAISDLVRENQPIVSRVAALSLDDTTVICTVVRGECLFGIERMPTGKRREALRAKMEMVLANVRCEAVPEVAADHYARIKRACQQKGTPLDEGDLWIAATTLALGAVLITRDGDFRNIDGLEVEDWSL